jgi:hypothetical protein
MFARAWRIARFVSSDSLRQSAAEWLELKERVCDAQQQGGGVSKIELF